MQRSVLLAFILILSAGLCQAQNSWWVFFQDKGPNAAQMLENPADFLSAPSLERRARLGIQPALQDLPVHSDYLNSLRESGLTVSGKSRWMNAAVVRGAELPADLQECHPFIREIRPVASLKSAHADEHLEAISIAPIDGREAGLYDYGAAHHQNQMLNISWLHNQNKAGQDILIAVFDAGFNAVDTLKAFDSVRTSGRLLGTWDFVAEKENVFAHSNHGLQVFSTIGAEEPGNLVGTAPAAQFLLARTEDASSESRQEEYNWVAAVEWADSMGVDIIHSSLGYNTFDNSDENYTFSDLDGNTSIITRAADMAAARGILVTTSAGNEGWGAWQRITAPCDGDSVLCVGAVDSLGRKAPFSSMGPSADGQVKPDVSAMGQKTAVMGKRGRVWYSNGTSYAAPQIAGFAACLMQAHPNASPMEVIQAIRESGDRFLTPDSLYGFGVPNARIADSLLTETESRKMEESGLKMDWKGNTLKVKTSGKEKFTSLRLRKGRLGSWEVLKVENASNLKLDFAQRESGRYTLEVGIGEEQSPRLIGLHFLPE